MPTYDLLVYHDFTDNLSESLRVGDPGENLAFGESLYVAAIGPLIHDSKGQTVVLAHGKREMPDIQRLLDSNALGSRRHTQARPPSAASTVKTLAPPAGG